MDVDDGDWWCWGGTAHDWWVEADTYCCGCCTEVGETEVGKPLLLLLLWWPGCNLRLLLLLLRVEEASPPWCRVVVGQRDEDDGGGAPDEDWDDGGGGEDKEEDAAAPCWVDDIRGGREQSVGLREERVVRRDRPTVAAVEIVVSVWMPLWMWMPLSFSF